MTKEQLKEKVREILEKTGCMNLIFLENGEDSLSVLFDSKDVISFKGEMPGWEYSGIQVDETGKHEFKITFKKLQMLQGQ